MTELKHLDRGYVNLHGKLKSLGANIERKSIILLQLKLGGFKMETIFDYNQIKQIIPHRQPFY